MAEKGNVGTWMMFFGNLSEKSLLGSVLLKWVQKTRLTEKKIPIIYKAKLSEIAKHLQKCKS